MYDIHRRVFFMKCLVKRCKKSGTRKCVVYDVIYVFNSLLNVIKFSYHILVFRIMINLSK